MQMALPLIQKQVIGISAERMAIHMQNTTASGRANSIKYVKLFTETTANAIYIQPLDTLALSDKGAVRTFLYAFKSKQ